MAEVDLKVMDMVERALEKTPDIGSSELFEKAKARHPGIADLSVRQFHARYPLQVKRRKSVAAPKKSVGVRKQKARKADIAERKPRARSRSRATATADRSPRDTVRGVLLAFATELASVEAKADVVKMLAGTDRYVDQIVAALES